MTRPMSDDPMILVRGRADAVKRALADAKIDPNSLTAAALCYLAMRLLGLKGPQIDEFLAQGPFATLQKTFKTLGQPGVVEAAKSFDPTDPDAEITLKQSELWAMIDGASRDKGHSH